MSLVDNTPKTIHSCTCFNCITYCIICRYVVYASWCVWQNSTYMSYTDVGM